ncbi:MAG: hypothetical protein JXR77_00280 [Lentisphaeria bacterium]|nr:hypothetical protein [Lentisphaeria bacterium]
MQLQPRWMLCALLLLGACRIVNPVRQPYTPHAQQREWVDEVAVINVVTRLTMDAGFASRRALAEERYAALLRYWYKRTSLAGRDLEGGIRALNFIRKVHFDAKGDRKLWNRAVELAREPLPGQDGIPLPPEFR